MMHSIGRELSAFIQSVVPSNEVSMVKSMNIYTGLFLKKNLKHKSGDNFRNWNSYIRITWFRKSIECVFIFCFPSIALRRCLWSIEKNLHIIC